MEVTDYLNKRTTNINIRVSPSLKSNLIREGAKLGINLSDYVNHALTMALEEPIKNCKACLDKEEEIKKLITHLEKFKDLTKPFSKMMEKGITLKKGLVQPKSEHELLRILLNLLKIDNNES